MLHNPIPETPSSSPGQPGRKRLSSTTWVWIVALSVGLAVTEAGKKPEKISFEPDWDPEAKVEGGPVLHGDTWLVADEGFTARLTQLDDESRWKYIQAMTEAEVDPFVDTDSDSPGFLTFALELESKTHGDLVLKPDRCRLITNRHEFRHPLDIVAIETSYRLQEAEVPPAYLAAQAALIPAEVTLENGQSGAGLMVYKGVDPKTRSFVVEVLLTTPKGELADYSLPYRRAEKKRD